MFHHTHPYAPFNLKNATKLIVGTLPPPRFTSGDLKKGDVNFSYGSIDGQLWPILDRIYNLRLEYKTTQKAIDQRKDFLISRSIGICDIVASCKRKKVDASDIGMTDIKLRDIFEYLETAPHVTTLLFTGGNSKNGPEYHFRKLAKERQVKVTIISSVVPRIHSFKWGSRTFQTVSLTAPSGAANRAVGSLALYKKLKAQNPKFTTIDFRVLQYAPYF